MTGFFELFQPGLKHLREERDRQKMLVSKPTIGGGAPLGIDLEGGKAKITISVPTAPQPDANEPEPTEPQADATEETADAPRPDPSAT